MKTKFYKLRRNSAVSGVLAGLSDKFGLDVGLVRFLFVLFTISNLGLGIIIYIILSSVMPYKEDVEEEMYGTGLVSAKKQKQSKKMTAGFGECVGASVWLYMLERSSDNGLLYFGRRRNGILGCL